MGSNSSSIIPPKNALFIQSTQKAINFLVFAASRRPCTLQTWKSWSCLMADIILWTKSMAKAQLYQDEEVEESQQQRSGSQRGFRKKKKKQPFNTSRVSMKQHQLQDVTTQVCRKPHTCGRPEQLRTSRPSTAGRPETPTTTRRTPEASRVCVETPCLARLTVREEDA